MIDILVVKIPYDVQNYWNWQCMILQTFSENVHQYDKVASSAYVYDSCHFQTYHHTVDLLRVGKRENNK